MGKTILLYFSVSSCSAPRQVALGRRTDQGLRDTPERAQCWGGARPGPNQWLGLRGPGGASGSYSAPQFEGLLYGDELCRPTYSIED